jgi:Na+/melibiose symporter-like transporter
MNKYLRTKQFKIGKKQFTLPVEALSYGIGLFGIALLTGWMPDYTKTYFADFAFKYQGFDSQKVATVISSVFLIAGIIGAVAEIVIGFLVDKTRSKRGKIQPWLLYGVLPLGIVSMLVFLAPKTNNFTLATVWMFVVYSLYVAVSVAVESPSNCFGAVCTPNPDERSDAISIASIFRSIGQSGGMVVLLVVGLIMKAAMGKAGFKAAEGKGIDLQISTAVCVVGCILFLSIMLRNTKERIPYSTEKVNLLQSLKFVFTNKNLLMVALAKLAGFGRGVYGVVSLYIAIYLLGDKGLKIALLLPMGIGTAVSMLIVKKLLKTIGTKNTFVFCSLYGVAAFALLFAVSMIIGFRKELIIPFLIINFLVGLQNGNTNLTPQVMIADCVDEIEWKTGKRQEGLCYAGYGLFSKIASAFTSSLGAFLVYKWSGYAASTDASIAYAPQDNSTLVHFLIIYTIIPACFVLLQIIPMLFYDLSKKKKAVISKELLERRGVVEVG